VSRKPSSILTFASYACCIAGGGLIAVGSLLGPLLFSVGLVLMVLSVRETARGRRELAAKSLQPAIRRGRPHPARLVPVAVVLLVGGAFLLHVVWHERDRSRPLHGGVTTTGIVAGYATGPGPRLTYRAAIIFTTADGQRVEYLETSKRLRPSIGKRVRVSYNPAHPTAVHKTVISVQTLLVQSFPAWVMLLMGVVLVVWLIKRWLVGPADSGGDGAPAFPIV
jgi:hypothetical protein